MKHPLLLRTASALFAATLAFPALAAPAAMMRNSSRATMTVDTTCMATAVVARDTAVSTALSTVVTAIQTRSQALAAAWANTDVSARNAAIKAANTAFAGTWKTFNTARTNAWSQYRTAAKACHSTTIETPSPSTGSL